jgi:hypothetical protein
MLSIVIVATLAFQSSPSILGCTPYSGQPLPTPAMTEATFSVGRDADLPLFRVSSAVLGENLTLAVSNGGTNEILFFEPDGSFKMRLGGTGAGPSEFRLLGRIHWVEGNRLAATGEALRKVVVMDFEDGFVGSHSFNDLKIQTVFPLPRGQWLAYSISAPPPKPGEGRFRTEGKLTVHDSDGRMQRELRTIPGFELIDLKKPAGGMARGFPPFRKGTHVSLDDTGCVWIATDDDANVQVYDLTGRRRGVVSLREYVPLEVTQAEWDEEIERMVEGDDNPSVQARFRRMLGRIPFDPKRPAFSGMEVDDAGRVWLTPYHNAGEDVAGWWVMAGLGVEPKWVPAPPGTRRLLEVRSGHVVLKHVSSLDVEVVTVRPLRYR